MRIPFAVLTATLVVAAVAPADQEVSGREQATRATTTTTGGTAPPASPSAGPDFDDELSVAARAREDERRAQERARRNRPDSKEDRKASRRRYKDKSAGDAKGLAKEKFPAVVGPPAADPPGTGVAIERKLSDHTAVVDAGQGKKGLLQSALPLTPLDERTRADLSMRETAEGYAPTNPLVRLTVPKRLSDGIGLGEDGVSVRPEGLQDKDVSLVGDQVFFANAAKDSDFLVAPMPMGGETFFQLRSEDSPERFSFKVGLPPGAELSGEPETGGAIASRDGEILALFLPPSAYDAEGLRVPVSMSVAGSNLVLAVPHRDGDWAYPLLVDPMLADGRILNDYLYWTERASATGEVDPNLGFERWEKFTKPERTPDGNPASTNNYFGYQTTPSTFHPQDSQGYGRGLYVKAPRTGAPTYSDGDYGEWIWRSPGDTYIYRAEYGYVVHDPAWDASIFTSPPTTNIYQGLWAAARGPFGNWEPGHYTVPPDTTPYSQSGKALAVTSGSLHYNYKVFCIQLDCSPTGGSPGNVMAFALVISGAGKISGDPGQIFMGGAATFYTDDNPPHFRQTITDGVPSGWTKDASMVLGGEFIDDGVGNKTAVLSYPHANGGAFADSRTVDCDGDVADPCPSTWRGSSWTWTWGVNAADVADGISTIRLRAADVVGNSTSAGDGSTPASDRIWTVKVDHSGPEITTLSGSLWDVRDELLLGRFYDLTVASRDGSESDPRSGVRRTELLVDGDVKDTEEASCPGGECAFAASHDLRFETLSVTPGEHSVAVRITDALGNATLSDSWTIVVDRDEDLPQSALSGTLADLDGEYVGSGTFGLTVESLDEEGFGMRRLGLEHEGQDMSGSPHEAACAPSCSPTFDSSFQVSTTQLPDGVHGFVVAATDDAGNVNRAERVEVLVDRTAPTPPAQIQLDDYDAGNQRAVVDWVEGDDPDLASEAIPGSGTQYTEYRFRRQGSWSAWTRTEGNEATLENATLGEIVDAEMRAIDSVGNVSSSATATLLIAPVVAQPSSFPTPPRSFTNCTPRIDVARARAQRPRYREFKALHTILGARLNVWCRTASNVKEVEIRARLAYIAGENEYVEVGIESLQRFKPRQTRDVKISGINADCEPQMGGRLRYVVQGTLKYIRDNATDESETFRTDPDDAHRMTCPTAAERLRRKVDGWRVLSRHLPGRTDDPRGRPRDKLRATLGSQPYTPRGARNAWQAHHVVPYGRSDARLMQASLFACAIHPNSTTNGVYLRGAGLKRTRHGAPNRYYRALQEHDTQEGTSLAERTYHGDTTSDVYVTLLHDRLDAGMVPNAERCPLGNGEILENELSDAKSDLRAGDFGVEQGN